MRKINALVKAPVLIVSWLLVGFGPLNTSVWSGEGLMARSTPKDFISKPGETEDQETRVIYGTIEGLTDSHIKIDSGEVGTITPRYLEVEKLSGKEDDLKIGDRVKIVIGSQNLVEDYSKAVKQ